MLQPVFHGPHNDYPVKPMQQAPKGQGLVHKTAKEVEHNMHFC